MVKGVTSSLVTLSNHVIQDMLMCISEIVVMEYLSEIRSGSPRRMYNPNTHD